MIAAQKVAPGKGWDYFRRQITTGDEQRPRGRELAGHQQSAGLPPGMWVGRAAPLLGVHGEVTEPQMRALFGEGLHPRADEIVAERIRAGTGVKQALRSARLGAAYYQFAGPTELANRIEDRVRDLERRTGRPATERERTAARQREGARMFRDEYGRAPKDGAELGRYTTRNLVPAKQPTAAFHLVLQAPPGFQAIVALGDEAASRAGIDSHARAVSETIAWIEDNALATRSGRGGIAQHDVTTGLVAAQFRHWDSRAGQPGLHDHLLIANKVQGPDGKWRTIDGRLLLAMTVAASEYYNERVLHHVCAALDLAVEPRQRLDGRRAVMDIAGIDTDLIDANTQRSHDIKQRLPALLDAYRAKHGREPSEKTRIRLQRQATLETRPPKKQARPLAGLRAAWRREAIAAFGPAGVDSLLEDARARAREIDRERPPATLDVRKAAAEVVDTVTTHRAVFGHRHLLAEARRWTTAHTSGRTDGTGWAEKITAHALGRLCLDLTPPDINPVFGPLTRADGSSIYRRRESQIYTTQQVLDAEDRIVAAARTPLNPACTTRAFDQAATRHPGPLDTGQRAMARAFATSDRQLVAAIGPAGAGKTTALRLAQSAITASGRRVIALAPSSRAAHVLGKELNRPAETLHMWLRRQQQADTGRLQLPRTERLRPGDVIIVDEAGMAATSNLAEITARAQQAGAHVRLIGDPWQLASVESGGALRLLATEVGAVHLDQVHRFAAPGEAAASLLLRDGTPEQAFTWYQQHRRISGGTPTDMADQVFAAWQDDLLAGRSTLMMAPDNDLVKALNARAQNWRLTSGQLHAPRHHHPVMLRDGHAAHIGDHIVTRRNQRRLLTRRGKDFVKNGDVWTLESYTPAGDAVVRHTVHRGRAVLPAAYLTTHTELGYATTIHRAQGMTVDAAHALLTSRTAREAAYVAATRGRTGNRLYLALEPAEDLNGALQRIGRYSAFSKSARQTIREEQERAFGIAQLAAEYADAAEQATAHRYRTAAARALGEGATALLADDAYKAVENALARAEKAGFTPERILAAAWHERAFTGADLAPAVLAWRIDRRVRTAHTAQADLATRADQPGRSRPLKDLDLEHLHHLADLAAAHRRRALTELRAADAALTQLPRPVTAHGLPAPAWPLRPAGHRTRAELAAAIHTRRAQARRAADTGDHRAELDHTEALHTLRTEQRLRAALPWRIRITEDRQREHPHSPARAPHPAEAALTGARDTRRRAEDARDAWTRADIITARIAAELRLREQLPDRQPPEPDHNGDLPDWLAPHHVLTDPLTPAHWRQHLTERRDVIEGHLTARGTLLAADPPTWTRPLGPVPGPESGRDLRAQWERTAALADAWRTLHAIDPDTPGIGERPDGDDTLAAAFDSLNARITALGRRTRAARQAQLRGRDPSVLTRAALRRLAALRLLRTTRQHPYPPRSADQSGPLAPAPRSPDPRIPQPLLPQAERLAHQALAASLAGAEQPQEWIRQIPAPDEDDTAQQHLYLRLVAAVADWRIRHGITGDDPLGPPPEDQHLTEWQHLSQALDLYRRARINDRLQLLRIRREEDRERLSTAARQTAADTAAAPASPRTPARPRTGSRPSRPRRPGPKRRR